MRKYFLLVFAVLLAACTRSASTLPVPETTEDPLDSVFATIATQTALAAQAHDPGLEPTIEPTSTSLFGATQTLSSSNTPEPTQTTTPAPTEDLPVPDTYALHAGEWPYCLARRFDIDPDALMAANGWSDSEPNNLSVGYEVVIPSDAGPFGGGRSLRAHPASYVVGGNETFYSIACAFGDVWPEHIASANGMDVDAELSGGQQIHIP